MNLTVVKSTPTVNSEQAGFINKLVSDPIQIKTKVFGVDKTTNTKKTFYIKTDAALPVNHKENLDLKQFNIVERPMKIVDEDSGEELTINCSWLHAKVAID